MMFSRFQPKPTEPEKPAPALTGGAKPQPAMTAKVNDAVDRAERFSTRYTELKVKLHQRLLEDINLAAIDKMPPEQFRREIGEVVRELLAQQDTPLNLTEQSTLVSDILDEVLGLGPLEPLLKDPSVNDILVNTADYVFVERKGKLELTAVRFKDNRHLLRIITKIVSAVGRRVDESQPMVDARLPDGSRVNAIVPPLSVDGPLLSIRKFSKEKISLAMLVDLGSMPREGADFLEACVQSRRNILISGGTGSGKTTLLNALSAFIGGHERILTIEDAAELQLQQLHVGRLETRPPNIEGRGEVTQRDLVKNALRMRPDRIIVGEVRAGEAFDMLQAMNTGHDGSMTTIHANSCRDALSRLEQMIGMAGLDLPTKSVRGQIASALNIVIQTQRMSDGRRRVTSINEITGMEGDVIQMQEIFRFERLQTEADGTIHGRFVATGIRPKCSREIETRGIQLPANLFDTNRVLS